MGPLNKCLNFGRYPDHRLDIEIVFRIRHGRYVQWLTDVNLLLILIRQITELVGRPLAEVCTVRMLLVDRYFNRKLAGAH